MGADLQAYDWYDDVSGFTFPILLIHGKYDAIPLASINRIQERAKRSHLLIFENSDHFPFIEERKKFTREVSTFLKNHLQP
jgi:proline iminopeptidase